MNQQKSNELTRDQGRGWRGAPLESKNCPASPFWERKHYSQNSRFWHQFNLYFSPVRPLASVSHPIQNCYIFWCLHTLPPSIKNLFITVGVQLGPLCLLRREWVWELRAVTYWDECYLVVTAPCTGLWLIQKWRTHVKTAEHVIWFCFRYNEMITMGLFFTTCNFLPFLTFTAAWPLTHWD